MDATQSRNNPWLDLVRSVAIVLVLLRHGERALHLELGQPQSVLQTIFMNGWVGVDLFFALSGYLIARHLLRAGIGSDHFHFGRYLAMRALRIIPAYVAVLVLVVAGAFPLFEIAPDGLGYRIAYHLLFLQDYFPSDINVVFWSLGVEEKFYLLAPLLMFAVLRCRRGWVRATLLSALFLLPVAIGATVYLQLDHGVDYQEFYQTFRSPFHMAVGGLVVGVAIAVAEHDALVHRSRPAGLAILFGGVAVLTAWLGTHDFMADIGSVDMLIQPPLIALLAGAITLGAVQLAGTPLPLTPLFHFLARISYSLYLIHFPLIPLAMIGLVSGGTSGFWLCYLTISLGATLLLHVAIERPFLVWKDRLGGRERLAMPVKLDPAHA